LGAIFNYDKFLLSSFTNYGVGFVRRLINRVTHSLARATTFTTNSNGFYHPPLGISLSILMISPSKLSTTKQSNELAEYSNT